MQLRLITLAAMLAAGRTANGQGVLEHIAMGDREYNALEAAAALGHYEQAIAADAGNYEALWKASRSAVDVGSYISDATRRTKLFASAEQYARKAVAVNPADAEGHFAVARALGKTALTRSPQGRVKYGTEVRAHALECLERSARHPGCLHVMGAWNAEVMRLNGFTRMIAKNLLGGRVFGSASWKEAVRYMEEAVAADPERVIHRVEMGEIYKDVGDKAKARVAFEAALRLPETDVNDRNYKAQARRALGSI